MPNITDVNVFTDPVDIPGDGAAANSASLLQFAQDLANRTRNLKNRVDILEGDTSAHEIFIPLSMGHAPDADYEFVELGGYSMMRTNSQYVVFPLNPLLRDGMVLSNTRARVTPGANTATGTSCMRLVVAYRVFDASLNVGAETVLADVYAADSSAAAQTLTDTIASHVVALSGREYVLRIKAASTATADNDRLDGIGLTVANPTSP